MQKRITRQFVVGAVAALGMIGGAASAADTVAAAELKPTQGSSVGGTVTFTEQAGKVRVVVNATGLSPGSHGFHVHEKGDCSAPDGTSAGGHFNPTAAPHGDPSKGHSHHAGDMPKLMADKTGKVQVSFNMKGVTLADGPTSLVNRAVIVHADADDQTTQPTGNSGARVACGLIARR
jgi:superoxide dismutase, Cu-Zn family